MKKATLCGLIGTIIICLSQIFWTIFNFADVAINDSLAKVISLIELFGVVGWLLISYFFIELYKKQK